MERVISFVHGMAMVLLVAVMLMGYWVLGAGVTAVQAQSPCGGDPFCHEGTRGSPLYAAAMDCSAPNCDSRIQWCCIEFP